MALFTRPQVPMMMTADTKRLTVGSTHSQPVSQIAIPAAATAAVTSVSAAMCKNAPFRLRSRGRAEAKSKGGHPVDENAGGGDPDDDRAGDRNRMVDPPQRLPGDAAGHHQQDDGIGEGGEDRAAAQPIGKPVARPKAAQHGRTPRQREAENVAEVVPGIGEQCQRPGEDPSDRLAGDIEKVEGDSDRKGTIVV